MHPHRLGIPPPPHVQPTGAHAPQLLELHTPQSRVPPQPSPIGPQFAFCAAQFVGTHGGRPHREGVPPPPHVSGGMHMPQSIAPPQPSPAGPQFTPAAAHVVHRRRARRGDAIPVSTHARTAAAACVGRNARPAIEQAATAIRDRAATSRGARRAHAREASAHAGTPPPPQVSGGVHAPQLTVPSEPSPISPHIPAVRVLGVHPGRPHTLGTPPPPHVAGAMQTPQLIEPPHPSGNEPQLSPGGQDVRGVQASGRMHSIASALPVTTAIDGMSPSRRLRGR